MRPISWQIDYYDPIAGLPMLTYESDGTINPEDIPADGIVYIWIRQTVNGKTYSMKCQGWDHYFLKEEENGVRFGGWVDADSPWGPPIGRDFFWENGVDGPTLSQFGYVKPDDIDDRYLKHGIMVTQPDSIILGLE